MKTFSVYILASQRNGTLYVGVTTDLMKRIWEHKNLIEKENPEWEDLYERMKNA